MSAIKIQEMWFYYQDFYHPVFQNVNLSLDTDWKLGLIGRNGRGKTTLLHLLNGIIEPSQGCILAPVQTSYFPYEVDQTYTLTMDVIKETVARLRTIEIQMDELLLQGEDMPVNEYLDLLDVYELNRGFEIESLIQKEVEQMELSAKLLEREFSTLSGGEKTSMMIIALFLRKDGFVLLDEPNNHLDQQKREALERYLKRKKGFILVSHNLDFLDQCIDHVLAINKADISLEQGNYTTWKINMNQREAYERRTQQRLIREIGQLERSATKTRQWSNVGNKQKYEFACHARTNGTQAYMQQAKRAEQKVIDHLEEKKQLLRNLEEEKMLWIQQMESEGCLLELKDYSFCYPNCQKAIIEHFDFQLYSGDRIGIAGKNGVGKSTFLKILATELSNLDMENGKIWMPEELSLAYAKQESDSAIVAFFELARNEKLGDNQKEREQYTYFMELCNRFDLPEDFLKRPFDTLSSGEKKKLDLARCLSQKSQLLLLDEPLNYMDAQFRKQLTKAILEQELTLIFVEHDEEFLNDVATKIVRM